MEDKKKQDDKKKPEIALQKSEKMLAAVESIKEEKKQDVQLKNE
jgi:hypothetical protein